MVGWHHLDASMGMSLSKLQGTGKIDVLQSMGSRRVGHD